MNRHQHAARFGNDWLAVKVARFAKHAHRSELLYHAHRKTRQHRKGRARHRVAWVKINVDISGFVREMNRAAKAFAQMQAATEATAQALQRQWATLNPKPVTHWLHEPPAGDGQ